MSAARRLALGVYARLLGLYPAGFRQDFAGEMQTVLEDRLRDAEARGRLALAGVFLHELTDLPGSLAREHRSSQFERHEERGQAMERTTGSIAPAGGPPAAPADWRQALLAAAPHWLLALMLLVAQGPALISLNLPDLVMIAVILLFLGALLAGLAFAWRAGWPAWSASIYGYVFPALVIAPMMVIQNLDGRFDRSYEFGYTFIGSPFIMAVILYRSMNADFMKGSLALLPTLVLLWTPTLEFVPNQVDLPVRVWGLLLAGLAALWIMKAGRRSAWVWVLLGFALFAGLPHAYARTYLNNLPPEHASPANLAEFFYWWIPTLFSNAGMAVGLLLASVAGRAARRSGPEVVTGYSLAAAGLFLNLLGNLLDFLVRGTGESQYARAAATPWVIGGIGLLVFGGLALSAAGALIFCTGLVRRRALKPGWRVALLCLVPLVMPAMVLAPLWFGTIFLPMSVPLPFYSMSLAEAGWIYAFGFVWMLAGALLITDLERRQPPAAPPGWAGADAAAPV